jgi:hypothetical protein
VRFLGQESLNGQLDIAGLPTAAAFTLPTQPALGTSLDLNPDWETRVGEANAFPVGALHERCVRAARTTL